MFSEEKVIDASLSPPDFPEKPCSSKPTKAELRRKARSDPEAADAEAIDNIHETKCLPRPSIARDFSAHV